MRILVLEDDFNNGLGALMAFPEAEDVLVVGTLDEFEKRIKVFQPNVCLLDMNFPMFKGSKPERLGENAGRICEEMNIPFAYVTGMGTDHQVIYAIDILDSKSNQLHRFESSDKSEEIWKKACECALGDV